MNKFDGRSYASWGPILWPFLRGSARTRQLKLLQLKAFSTIERALGSYYRNGGLRSPYGAISSCYGGVRSPYGPLLIVELSVYGLGPVIVGVSECL